MLDNTQHKVVLTRAIQEEWNKHQSLTTLSWRATMIAQKRVCLIRAPADLEPGNNQPIGAAWIRLLIGDDKTSSYVNDFTPELAIAVLPAYIGSGVGTQLLTHVLEAAKKLYSSVVLSVRATNPAKRLYERMGFVVAGKTTNRVGTESLKMLIDLQ